MHTHEKLRCKIQPVPSWRKTLLLECRISSPLKCLRLENRTTLPDSFLFEQILLIFGNMSVVVVFLIAYCGKPRILPSVETGI